MSARRSTSTGARAVDSPAGPVEMYSRELSALNAKVRGIRPSGRDVGSWPMRMRRWTSQTRIPDAAVGPSAGFTPVDACQQLAVRRERQFRDDPRISDRRELAACVGAPQMNRAPRVRAGDQTIRGGQAKDSGGVGRHHQAPGGAMPAKVPEVDSGVKFRTVGAVRRHHGGVQFRSARRHQVGDPVPAVAQERLDMTVAVHPAQQQGQSKSPRSSSQCSTPSVSTISS